MNAPLATAPSCLPYIAGAAKEAEGSKAQLLSILASQAVDSLSGTRYAIADALDQVPSKPGLYAVYADPKTWQELNLEIRVGCPTLGIASAVLLAPSIHRRRGTSNPRQTGHRYCVRERLVR
jgi:hypothetical protein